MVVELGLPFGDVVEVGIGVSGVVTVGLLLAVVEELLSKLLLTEAEADADADADADTDAVMILVDTESAAGIRDWVSGDDFGEMLVGFGWEKVLGLQVLPSFGTALRVT